MEKQIAKIRSDIINSILDLTGTGACGYIEKQGLYLVLYSKDRTTEKGIERIKEIGSQIEREIGIKIKIQSA